MVTVPHDTPARRFKLSRPTILGSAVMLGIAARALHDRLSDPDLWWHLRTGALIVSRHAIPRTDPYSFTANGKPWIVQEWGSEVILHGIQKAFGLYGIIAWRAIMVVLVYSLVARLILRETGNTVLGWMIVSVSAFAGATSWTERPNLFSFLLFVIVLSLVRRHDRRVWWIVPLCALWANLHGMVLLGLGLVLLIALTEWLKVFTRWAGSDRVHAARLSLVFLASTGAAMLNPYGPQLLVHAFRLVNIVSNVVTEWASPSFHEAGTLAFLLLIVVTVAALALTPVRADPTDVALAVAFIVLGLFAVRNLPVSGMVLGIVCARTLPGALRATFGERARAPEIPAMNILLFVVVLALFGTLIARTTPSGSAVSSELPRAAFCPGKTTRDIPQRFCGPRLFPDGARLFTRDSWAGLAIFERWPSIRVAFDTRVDFYGPEATRQYRRTIGGLVGWDNYMQTNCVTHVLISLDDPLVSILDASQDWLLSGNEGPFHTSPARLVVFERTKPYPPKTQPFELLPQRPPPQPPAGTGLKAILASC